MEPGSGGLGRRYGSDIATTWHAFTPPDVTRAGYNVQMFRVLDCTSYSSY
ncbi:hypothetical protein Hanom_Chr14g01278561 [Helianthus anomalus]